MRSSLQIAQRMAINFKIDVKHCTWQTNAIMEIHCNCLINIWSSSDLKRQASKCFKCSFGNNCNNLTPIICMNLAKTHLIQLQSVDCQIWKHSPSQYPHRDSWLFSPKTVPQLYLPLACRYLTCPTKFYNASSMQVNILLLIGHVFLIFVILKCSIFKSIFTLFEALNWWSTAFIVAPGEKETSIEVYGRQLSIEYLCLLLQLYWIEINANN